MRTHSRPTSKKTIFRNSPYERITHRAFQRTRELVTVQLASARSQSSNDHSFAGSSQSFIGCERIHAPQARKPFSEIHPMSVSPTERFNERANWSQSSWHPPDRNRATIIRSRAVHNHSLDTNAFTPHKQENHFQKFTLLAYHPQSVSTNV